MFEDIGKQLAAFTALLLVLSVAFDWAYLFALGLSFYDVSTTLADHTRSSIIWLPALGLCFLLDFIWGVFRPAKPRSASANMPTLVENFFHLLGVFFICVISALVAAVFPIFQVSLFIAMCLCAACAFFRPGEKQVQKLAGAEWSRYVFRIPLVLVMVTLMGAVSGGLLLLNTRASATISTNQGGVTTQVQVIGIRRFSAVVVFVSANHETHVLPADAVLGALYKKSNSVAAWCQLLPQQCLTAK